MLHINILTRYDHKLFDQHIDREQFDGRITFHENSTEDIEWDCVVVFDGLRDKVALKVASSDLWFVAGEPPDALTYTAQFLAQFDRTYCAHPAALGRQNNEAGQYFNNWHFGYEHSEHHFRYCFEQVRDLAPPAKQRDLSVVMSSLAYMPNHLKRLTFLEALRRRFGERVDVYGRGHRFIPYKEDAILPYRFHLCIENCALPDLWTEKIADPLLGYAVPVYAGCPNISEYFPQEAIVALDMDNIQHSLAVIERLLAAPEAEYGRRLPFVNEARKRLLGPYNLIHQLADFVEHRDPRPRNAILRTLVPNEQTLTYPIENALLRGRRLAYRKYYELTRRSRSAVNRP